MIMGSSFPFHVLEAVAQTCSVEKVFLQISHNSRENTFFYRAHLVAAAAVCYFFLYFVDQSLTFLLIHLELFDDFESEPY